MTPYRASLHGKLLARVADCPGCPMFHCHGQTDRRVRVEYIRLLADCKCFCSNLLCTRGHRISDGQPQYDTQTVGQSRVTKDSLGRADTCDRITTRRRACNRQMLLSLQIHQACPNLWRRGLGFGQRTILGRTPRYLGTACAHLNRNN